MITLQANWVGNGLHVWGLRDGETLAHDELRRVLGDAWDTLLASAADEAGISLRWPDSNDRPLDEKRPSPTRGDATLRTIPTLAFTASEAMDLLAMPLSGSTQAAVEAGDSLRFWSKAARMGLELLAKQRFVPDLHAEGGDRYRGFWRAVIDDSVSQRVNALAAAMPPVCHAMTEGGPHEPSALLESFLWQAVDAFVRRCLDGDELAHALHEQSLADAPPQVRWLRSLVESDAALGGAANQNAALYQTVRGWLSRLDPPPREREFRTCFRLESPIDLDKDGGRTGWRLSLQVQLLRDDKLIVDAAELIGGPQSHPRILPRPFDDALSQVRTDAAQAAAHVPALVPCGVTDGPLECAMNLSEAYAFLRDAAPVLQLEGFGVFVPSWWEESRFRPRMRLHVRPKSDDATVGFGAMRLDAIVEYDWKVAVGDLDLSLDEITQLAAAKEPLVRLGGHWAEVRGTELQTALKFLQRQGKGEITLLEALRQCYVAEDLETGLPVDGLRGQGWVETLLGVSERNEQLESLEPPKGFKGSLRPYQLRGLDWLMFLSRLGLGGCLADDMGLGKTIQLIALLLKEREKGEPLGQTLLVVPMSLVGNWRREIERFGPSLRAMVHHGLDRRTGQEFLDEVARHDVVISTYALTHRDFEHLSGVQWHRVALDEAQNVKNPAAKQSVAVRGLRAVNRLALTGTPVENRLSELWSIMDFLNVGYLGNASDFRRRFAGPIERAHDSDRAARLKSLIRPFVLRRLKSDPTVQIDLPEKMEMKVFCNLTKEQAALYEATVGEMLGQIDRAGGIQRRGLILATLVKLKQVCNHPALFLGDGSELPHRSGKCDRLSEMLEEVLAEGDRALIFTQYREMGDLLKKLLESTFGREILFLHGGVSQPQRDVLVDRFQSRDPATPIFLLSLKAGGFGLNLTAANHVFHYDRWWNPAVEAQATDRAHRIGQTQQVQVHKFVCIGTLEERIDALLEHKRNLADNVIGSGEEQLTELSTDALRDLLRLSRDAVGEE